MRKTFNGMYFKHQNGIHAISLIAGVSTQYAFIQLITNKNSYSFEYPLSAYEQGDTMKIGGSVFSKDSVRININEKNISIYGEIRNTGLTPLRYDIMGPFKYIPMQCKHTVISLHHMLDGKLAIDNEIYDFSGGVGYIEGDFGTSFPKNYVWIQSNDFPEKGCIMASVADIPLTGLHFRGCICIVYHHGTEYRLATYLGVKIVTCSEHRIKLKQGKLILEIDIDPEAGHKLFAPDKGEMIREIREHIVCAARFKFMKDGEALINQSTKNASFEYV